MQGLSGPQTFSNLVPICGIWYISGLTGTLFYIPLLKSFYTSAYGDYNFISQSESKYFSDSHPGRSYWGHIDYFEAIPKLKEKKSLHDFNTFNSFSALLFSLVHKKIWIPMTFGTFIELIPLFQYLKQLFLSEKGKWRKTWAWNWHIRRSWVISHVF